MCMMCMMCMKNNELKKVCIQNCTCYYFDDVIKIEDFDFDIVLMVEKSYGNIWIYVSYKTLTVENHHILFSTN